MATNPDKGLWLLFAFGCGIAALFLGQDANWDLRNYHLYIPYAFLEGRFDWDVAPAQVANFYNPLLYVPFYYSVMALPPKLFGFGIGFIQGLNGLMIGGIARHLMGRSENPPHRITLFLLVLLGLTGAGFISEIGTSFADTILSLVVLGSLWLNLICIDRQGEEETRLALRQLILSGFLMGLAAGLKQPMVIYAGGLCVSFLFASKSFPRGVSMAFLFGLGVLAGIGITGGFWMYELWSRYGNPLFPYFNDLFQSPWATTGNYRDGRFLPKTLWEVFLFPLYFTFAPLKTAEISFRDFRLPLLYVLSVGYGLYILYGRFQKNGPLKETASDRGARYLFVFGLISFFIWLKLFAIYRYLIILEMLAPLGIWWILHQRFGKKSFFLKGTFACSLFLFLSTQPGNWERVSWGSDYFGVTVPQLEDPGHTLVLMAGTEPMSYVIPFFPKSVRFLRIQSYFTGPSDAPNQFDKQMQALVRDHAGPIHALYRRNQKKAALSALSAYGLFPEEAQCTPLPAHIESHLKFPIIFCKVISTSKRGNNPMERELRSHDNK
ncbi:MAG: hypothetical protein V2B19_01625 [Pseudomonadota bacterium]